MIHSRLAAKHMDKIEFSFLNGNLMVPTSRLLTYRTHRLMVEAQMFGNSIRAAPMRASRLTKIL
jgi:hypothetical protein